MGDLTDEDIRPLALGSYEEAVDWINGLIPFGIARDWNASS
ncbi:hypothetical protein HMSSN036_86730 [Paenibacillus macerans]|nr:hypothetical protein HMSSN036_86730 [Paenibacillus macerans]